MNQLADELEIVLLKIRYEFPYCEKLSKVFEIFDNKYNLYEKYGCWEYEKFIEILETKPLNQEEKQ